MKSDFRRVREENIPPRREGFLRNRGTYSFEGVQVFSIATEKAGIHASADEFEAGWSVAKSNKELIAAAVDLYVNLRMGYVLPDDLEALRVSLVIKNRIIKQARRMAEGGRLPIPIDELMKRRDTIEPFWVTISGTLNNGQDFTAARFVYRENDEEPSDAFANFPDSIPDQGVEKIIMESPLAVVKFGGDLALGKERAMSVYSRYRITSEVSRLLLATCSAADFSEISQHQLYQGMASPLQRLPLLTKKS